MFATDTRVVESVIESSSIKDCMNSTSMSQYRYQKPVCCIFIFFGKNYVRTKIVSSNDVSLMFHIYFNLYAYMYRVFLLQADNFSHIEQAII